MQHEQRGLGLSQGGRGGGGRGPQQQPAEEGVLRLQHLLHGHRDPVLGDEHCNQTGTLSERRQACANHDDGTADRTSKEGQ